jgi:hypothetical protein
MGLSSKIKGDLGLGLERGSELERMLEKDMTPAARLGVWRLDVSGRKRKAGRRVRVGVS